MSTLSPKNLFSPLGVWLETSFFSVLLLHLSWWCVRLIYALQLGEREQTAIWEMERERERERDRERGERERERERGERERYSGGWTEHLVWQSGCFAKHAAADGHHRTVLDTCRCFSPKRRFVYLPCLSIILHVSPSQSTEHTPAKLFQRSLQNKMIWNTFSHIESADEGMMIDKTPALWDTEGLVTTGSKTLLLWLTCKKRIWPKVNSLKR